MFFLSGGKGCQLKNVGNTIVFQQLLNILVGLYELLKLRKRAQF